MMECWLGREVCFLETAWRFTALLWLHKECMICVKGIVEHVRASTNMLLCIYHRCWFKNLAIHGGSACSMNCLSKQQLYVHSLISNVSQHAHNTQLNHHSNWQWARSFNSLHSDHVSLYKWFEDHCAVCCDSYANTCALPAMGNRSSAWGWTHSSGCCRLFHNAQARVVGHPSTHHTHFPLKDISCNLSSSSRTFLLPETWVDSRNLRQSIHTHLVLLDCLDFLFLCILALLHDSCNMLVLLQGMRTRQTYQDGVCKQTSQDLYELRNVLACPSFCFSVCFQATRFKCECVFNVT